MLRLHAAAARLGDIFAPASQDAVKPRRGKQVLMRMFACEAERAHQPGDRPDDPTVPDLRPRTVRVEMTPEAYALWRQARSVVAAECGSELDDGEFVEALCRAVIAPGTGAAGPAHQIAYKQCPDCRRATQNGAGREIDVAPEVIERAECDARIIGSLDAPTPERATTTVTPRMREQVFARDQHRCTVPGCARRGIWMFITSSNRHAAARTSCGI